jgi:hypothetical protein
MEISIEDAPKFLGKYCDLVLVACSLRFDHKRLKTLLRLANADGENWETCSGKSRKKPS